jgi:hypothetical protein
MRSALAIVGLLLIGSVAQADPVETLRARRHTPVGQAVVLRTHAHWDANCKPSADPRIDWVTEPAHGKVDQDVEIVKARANVVGATNCEGVEMRGLRLTYHPQAGFKGEDALTYDVRYDARYPVVRYEFRVSVE